MELPPVPVDPGQVLNEYAEQNSNLTAANIRLRVMVKYLWDERNTAMRNWEQCAQELQELRRKFEPQDSPEGARVNGHV